MTSTITNSNDLADKIFSLIRDFLKDRSRGFSESVKQLNKETIFTDVLQQLVDYGNLDILNSFKIRLEMEEYVRSNNFAKNGGIK
jgi:hypothetical protein